jgi:hypothetical protein
MCICQIPEKISVFLHRNISSHLSQKEVAFPGTEMCFNSI